MYVKYIQGYSDSLLTALNTSNISYTNIIYGDFAFFLVFISLI